MQKRKPRWTTSDTLGLIGAIVVAGALLAAFGQIAWTLLFEAPPFTLVTAGVWLATMAIVIWFAKRSEAKNGRHNSKLWSIAIIATFAGGLSLALAARDFWLIPTFRPSYQQISSDEMDAIDEECRDYGSRTC